METHQHPPINTMESCDIKSDILELGHTELPYYDLQAYTQSHTGTRPTEVHHVSLPPTPLDADREMHLKAFATFVGAVTELTTVAFIAKYLGEAGQPETHLIIASTSAAGKPHSYNSNDGTVKIMKYSTPEKYKFDFEIQLLPVVAQTPAERSFVLYVSPSSASPEVSIEAQFDKAHGPLMAATHLTTLAAAYLASNQATTVIQPALSALNYPPSTAAVADLRVDTIDDANEVCPRPMLLHGAVERRASQTPFATAVEYVEGELSGVVCITYSELNQRAEHLATELTIRQELCPAWPTTFRGQRTVPVFLPGSPAFYTGILGILKAGMAFCSLPMDAPARRLVDILEDVQSDVVLGSGSVPFPGLDLSALTDNETRLLRGITWIDINNVSGWRASLCNTNIPLSAMRREPVSSDLAYILYTSGSTGKPKGVMISHEMVTLSIRAHAEAFEPMPSGAELRWLQFGVPTFDLTMVEIFLTLSYGGTLCAADRSLLLSDVEAAMNFFKVTNITCVPTMASLIRPQNVPKLETLICGGEIVTKYAIDNFSSDATICDPPKRLINVYGPTEATINNSAEITRIGNRGSIAGPALSGCSILIIDANLADQLVPVPMGLTGEILLAGDLVGYGYLNRPEETDRVFTSGLGFDRTYRTGDKGRIVWSPEGQPKLEVLGRLNMDQVKLNGRRVELGEIESVVLETSAVKEIATAVLDGSHLVAFLVIKGENSRDLTFQAEVLAQCRAAAKRGLPDWMRPLEYAILESIPRISSGKVDRKRLQSHTLQQFGSSFTTHSTQLDSVPVADFDDEESISAAIKSCLRSALGANPTHNTDVSLKACGMDSLQAMKFLQSLRQLGVANIGIDTVLNSVTIQDLVDNTRRQHKERRVSIFCQDEDDEIPLLEDEEEILGLSLPMKLKHFATVCRPTCARLLGVSSEDISHILPATGLQTRGFANIAEAEALGLPKAWAEHYPYTVPDHIDPERLEQAIAQAAKNYSAFRTLWAAVEHPLSPFAACILSPSAARALHPVLKTTVPFYSKDRNSLWQQTIIHAQLAAEESFGIGSPCFVTNIIQSADKAHCVMVFSMFHVMYDGLSLQKLASDIERIYYGQVVREESRPGLLAPVESHFGADWVANSVYWIKRLAGVPPFRLGNRELSAPCATFKSIRSHRGASSEELRSKTSLQDLFFKSKENRLPTPMAIVQGAWAMALAQTFKSRDGDLDVQFGGISHGRNTPEALDVFALMLQPSATRISFSASKHRTHRDICEDVFAQSLEALPHMEVPCPDVQYARATRRFDTSIFLQAFPVSVNDTIPTAGFPTFNRLFDGLDPWAETNSGNPILMEVWPGADGPEDKLCLRLSYIPSWPGYSHLNPTWIQGLLAIFDQALDAIITNPEGAFHPLK